MVGTAGMGQEETHAVQQKPPSARRHPCEHPGKPYPT